MQRDSVNPGLQAGLPVEMLHATEHLQKDFLRSIGGISGGGDDTVHEAINWLMKLTNEPGVSFLRPALQFGHNRRLMSPDSYCAGNSTQDGCSRHRFHCVPPL